MPTATLGGFTILGSSPATWALREGTSPNIETFDVIPEDAGKLLAGGGPYALVLENVTVKNLWVIGEAPSESPYFRRVKVADRRWFWPYALVVRNYNIRQRTGYWRSPSVDGQLMLSEVMDKFQFAPWSLRNLPAGGDPSTALRWKAEEVIRDVFDEVFKSDLGMSPQLNLTDIRNDIPIEDLEIKDAGDVAIDRVLQYVPQMRVWIDYDGTVTVSNRTTGGEQIQKDKLLPELMGFGHIVTLNQSLLRPARINVYFTREIEVRFDFAEPSTYSGNTQVLNVESRVCDNVLPVPDFILPDPNPTWCEGTWITFNQAFDAWGKIADDVGYLDYDMLCKAFVPFMDIMSILQAVGANNTRVNWGARLAAVQQHWRQTFRINPRWKSRIKALRPYRVATLDTTTGKRSPAVAYCDYMTLGTQRLWMKNFRDATDQEFARNYVGYPSTGTVLDNTFKPAPGIVSIVDEDQGIIRLDFIMDPIRLTDCVIPGNMVESSRPSSRIDQVNNTYRPITFDSVIRGTQADNIPRLKPAHKIAFVMTAIPGAPNNNTQLHKVTIFPYDVGVKGTCQGPVWNVFVGANIETARIKWSDADAAVIEKAFGIGNDVPASANDEALYALDGLCVNLLGPSEGAASLRGIALAVAARIYGRLADHLVGSAAGIMNPALRPMGWISEIVHEIGTNGAPVTKMHMPDTIPALSLFSYLDPDTRATVMRLVK
jgi:hypothetical protein